MSQCTNNIPIDVSYGGTVPKVMNRPDIVARYLADRFNNAVAAVAQYRAQMPMPVLDGSSCDDWKTQGSIPANQFKPFKRVMENNGFTVNHGKPADSCVCSCK